MTIKDARIEARITQRQMSEWLNIPLRTIENWEEGKTIPPEYVKSLIIEKLIRKKNEMLEEKLKMV